MRISSPSTYIDDVKGLVQKCEQSSQLGEWYGVLQVDRVRCKRTWRCESSETQVDILYIRKLRAEEVKLKIRLRNKRKFFLASKICG